MKRMIFSAMLLFSVTAYSQENDPVILYKPYQAGGFLVLNKDYDTNIDHWTIEYSIKNIDENGIETYNIIDKGSFYGQDYIEVKEEYYKEEVYGTIKGWSVSNAEIVIEGPILLGIPDFPINSFYPTRVWTCNGTYYAYEIVQLQNETGQSKLKIDNAYDNSLSLPYYQYTGSAGLDPLIDYHQIQPIFAQPDPEQGYNPQHIVHFSNTVNTYYTATGTAITDNVYGVRKSMGPWDGAINVFLETEFIFDENAIGSFTLDYMINFYNTHGGAGVLAAEGLPPLECAFAIGESGTIGIVGDTPPCYGDVHFILGVDGDVNDLLDAIEEACYTLTFEDVQVELEHISGGTGSGTTVVRPFGTAKFDSNGEIISNPITVTPGLYRIKIETTNGEYYVIYKEVKETFVNALEMADFLTPTVFPVPITGEQFTLNLKADAKLKFRYILSDLDGNQLYSKNFVLQKDHDRNHVIKPHGNNNFPSGILVNTFLFEDGSVLSFETIKN